MVIIFLASSLEKGFKLSWSLERLFAISAGIISGRVDKSWPNFINIGPASSKATTSLSPLGKELEKNCQGEKKKTRFQLEEEYSFISKSILALKKILAILNKRIISLCIFYLGLIPLWIATIPLLKFSY